MKHRTVVPRMHVVTSTQVLADPDFASRATDVLWAVSETFSVPVRREAPRPDAGAWLEPDTAATLALHLRGRVSGRRLHELAAGLRPVLDVAGAILLVNDRVDVARSAGADGAHLPTRGLPVAAARAQLGPHALLGASVHDDGEYGRATGADYVFFGHVWDTPSHPTRAGRGLDALAEIVGRRDATPVLAIGGVTPERVHEAMAAGASGVATITGVWSAKSPPDAAIRYLQAVSDATPGEPA